VQGVLVREGRNNPNTCKLWRSSSSGAGGVLPNSAWRDKKKGETLSKQADGWMAGETVVMSSRRGRGYGRFLPSVSCGS
jgi:hypothetical protein